MVVPYVPGDVCPRVECFQKVLYISVKIFLGVFGKSALMSFSVVIIVSVVLIFYKLNSVMFLLVI